VAAWLSQLLGSPLVFAVAIAGVSALVVAGHVVQARTKPEAIGLTTEAAALGVCLLGGACVAGYPEIALALGIATSAVLAYKQPLHELVGRLGTEDIDAGVKLLVATFIVLPLLPREALDPLGAIRPYSLWQLVILVASLSLVGYVATRALGPQRGTAVTGLAGGLVSSTAVTLAFARRSREEGGKTDEALAAGVEKVVGRPYWTYEDEIVGAGGHYLEAGVDGVVAVVSFGCGPDSTMIDVVQRFARRPGVLTKWTFSDKNSKINNRKGDRHEEKGILGGLAGVRQP